jgi:O-antigen ligase
MLPFLPALLALLSGVWCGTFYGGATWAGSAAAAVLPLALLVVAGVDGWDPLRLGRAGRLLPVALWITAAASAWASPVPRSGRVALLLLPAYLALPGAVARSWAAEPTRRIGLRAFSAVVGIVALLSIAGLLWLHTDRASFPLGHHNLLAAWLVILLPLAFLPAREAGPWRWLGWGSGLAGMIAVLASRSFLGALALAILGLLALAPIARRRRHRLPWIAVGIGLLVLLGLLGGVLQWRRAGQILSGADLSLQARLVYYRAGWEGFRARPLLGWGPGSTAWTVARFLRPRPEVNPPGEVLGELHSLPLALAYELGITGLLVAGGLAALFLLRRGAERKAAADRPLLAAGLLGLLGAGVLSLGAAPLAVTALPLAAALAAGASLAAFPALPGCRPRRLAPAIYAVACLGFLSPLLLASWRYERAIAEPEAARDHLARAVALDPSFPLYRARLAWLPPRREGGLGESADLALQAAEGAREVAPLWLTAGFLGMGANRPWARPALARACALDPLAPLAPYLLAVVAPGTPEAPLHAAHGLLAEPRLLAATFWSSHEPLLAAALRAAGAWDGVDPRWREALLALSGRLPADDGERDWLGLGIDAIPALSFSLYTFRRPPWPLDWPRIRVRRAAAAAVAASGLAPATTLGSSAVAAFSRERCAPLSPCLPP